MNDDCFSSVDWLDWLPLPVSADTERTPLLRPAASSSTSSLASVSAMSSPPPASSPPRRLCGPLAASGALFVAYGIGWGAFYASAPAFKERTGCTPGQFAVVLVANLVGHTAAQLALPPLSHRLGAHAVVTASTLGFGGGLAALGAMASPLGAAATMVAVGGCSGLMDTSISLEVSRSLARGGPPRFSTMHALYSLGSIAAAAATAAALTRGAPVSSVLAFSGATLAAFAIGAAYGFAPSAPASKRPAGPVPRESATVALSLLALIGALSAASEGAVQDWLGIYGREELHAPLGAASGAYLAYSATSIAGRLVGDHIPGLSAPIVMAAGGALSAAGMGLCLVSQQIGGVDVGAAIIGLALANMTPALQHTASGLRGPNDAVSLGVVTAVANVGAMAGPPAIGALASAVGLRRALWGVVAIGAVKLALAPAVAASLRPLRRGAQQGLLSEPHQQA